VLIWALYFKVRAYAQEKAFVLHYKIFDLNKKYIAKYFKKKRRKLKEFLLKRSMNN
jgi:hypothetical protein